MNYYMNYSYDQVSSRSPPANADIDDINSDFGDGHDEQHHWGGIPPMKGPGFSSATNYCKAMGMEFIPSREMTAIAAADPTVRRFPTEEYKSRNLTHPRDIEVLVDGFTHVRCPFVKYECPACECDRNMCHLDSLIVAVDGACPGNGTAAAVKSACGVYLRHADHPDLTLVFANRAWRVPNTPGQPHTSSRAELHAAIGGIRAAMQYVRHGGQWDGCQAGRASHRPRPCRRVKHVVIKSDSAYVVDGMTDPGYVAKWLRNGWVTAAGKQPVRNRDLWEELLRVVREVEDAGAFVSFWLVKRRHNREADWLANEGLKKARTA